MRSPKITTKRVLGLVMSAALAVTGVVAVAGSSEAAVAALKLSPATGSSAGGTIVSITGKDFQTAAGVSKVGTVFFSTSTCAIANIGTNAVVTKSVVSATKVNITTPALALVSSKPTAYNLCLADVAGANVIGAAKFTSYAAPTVNDQTAVATAGVSVLSGASYGGGTIVITGENFTAKTTAKIGNLPIAGTKVVIGTGTSATATGGDDTLTGTIPAGTGTGKIVSVTTEGGTVNALVATQKFDYLDSLKIAPAYGDGTAGNVIQITGTGFLARTFTNGAVPTATSSAIALNVATQTPAVAGTYASAVGAAGVYCGTVQVESDTSLSCKVPVLALATKSGAYTVQIVDGGASAIGAVTAVSRSAQYTVSAF